MRKCHLGILSNTYSAYKPLTCKTMYEYVEILPKYMIKMPLGASTNTMGHSPIRKLKNFARKISFPNPFKK